MAAHRVARHRVAWPGMDFFFTPSRGVGRAGLGKASRGAAGHGAVLSHLQLWRGHGSPRLGSVRSGYVRHGSARRGFFLTSKAGCGRREAWRGKAQCGKARRGMDFLTHIRGVDSGMVNHGTVRFGRAAHGEVLMGAKSRKKTSSNILNQEWRPDNYSLRMASPCWEKKRQERLQIDGHICQTCCHDGTNWSLEVHHKTYERFWHENVQTDLITLCRQCHNAVTDVIRRRRYAKRKLDGNYIVMSTQKRKAVPK